MVLSTQNSGKYLSKQYTEERNLAEEDAARFTSGELTYLGVANGTYGRADQVQRDATNIDPGVNPRWINRRNAVDARDLGDTGRI